MYRAPWVRSIVSFLLSIGGVGAVWMPAPFTFGTAILEFFLAAIFLASAPLRFVRLSTGDVLC